MDTLSLESPTVHDALSDANLSYGALADEPRCQQDPDAFPADPAPTEEELEQGYREHWMDCERNDGSRFERGVRVRVPDNSSRTSVGRKPLAGMVGVIDAIIAQPDGTFTYDVLFDHLLAHPMRCSFPFSAWEIEPEVVTVVQVAQGMAWVASLSDDTLIDAVETVKAHPSLPGVPAETREKFLRVAAAELSRRFNDCCGLPTTPKVLLSAAEMAELTGAA